MPKLRSDTQQILQTLNHPIEGPALIKTLTLEKCMKAAIANFPEMEKDIYAHVMKQVISIAAFFNTARNMNDTQAGEVAQILIEKFRDWSVEDFALWAKTVKYKQINGISYPQSYQTIDPATIVSFADTYAEAKAIARENMWAKEKGEFNRRPESGVKTNEEWLQAFLNQAKENVEAEKKKKPVTRNEELRSQLGVEINPTVTGKIEQTPVLKDVDKGMIDMIKNLLDQGATFQVRQEIISRRKILLENEAPPAWLIEAERLLKLKEKKR